MISKHVLINAVISGLVFLVLDVVSDIYHIVDFQLVKVKSRSSLPDSKATVYANVRSIDHFTRVLFHKSEQSEIPLSY